MLTDSLTRASVGLLPVLIFLVILLYMDSYKLVSDRPHTLKLFGTCDFTNHWQVSGNSFFWIHCWVGPCI
jgi:hypothetical protein